MQKGTPTRMAVYWHPFLAQFIRDAYGDRLIVEEEVSLGDMPLRVDLLLIRRERRARLPYPFNLLGERTLVSYCGPEDRAMWQDLAKLEVYGILYQLRERLKTREAVTLWLVASRFAGGVGKDGGARLTRMRAHGQGTRQGTLHGFPTCLIDLNSLPVGAATLPLLLAAKGRVERRRGEYLLDHPELRRYLLPFARLHWDTLTEVLTMRHVTPDQVGWTEKQIRQLVEWLGRERIVHSLGEEHVLELLVEERVRNWLEERKRKDGRMRRRRRHQKQSAS